ncbi:DUF5937 family protein [Streptomyces sp. NPDC089919]|uniref:DUF5937 family protein n=1 Tax=Streptomyces sp. NPDC089919 TaxID=3155188 RepID=UPI00342C3B95
MGVTIEVGGLPPERIRFAVSPLAELCMVLHALAQPDHHPRLASWTTATNARLAPDLADRLLEAGTLWQTSFSDVFMPFAGIEGGDGLPHPTLAGELDRLDLLPEERFVGAALEHCALTHYNEGGGPSPLTDAGARARALEIAAARGPRQLDFTVRLLEDPPGVRAWLRRLLEDCESAFFGETWERIRPGLAADARHKTEVLRRKGLPAALEAVSAALSLDPSGTLITVDKMTRGDATALDPELGPGLVLVPSTFGWPHLMVLHARGWRPVVHYPVGSPELPGPGQLELLQLRMEALAHPLRMHLCRTLARGPYTTGELATTYGITAPEVSRHLSVLKKAGLLTTRRQGRYVHHQLDLTVVARLGSDFLEGILR